MDRLAAKRVDAAGLRHRPAPFAHHGQTIGPGDGQPSLHVVINVTNGLMSSKSPWPYVPSQLMSPFRGLQPGNSVCQAAKLDTYETNGLMSAKSKRVGVGEAAEPIAVDVDKVVGQPQCVKTDFFRKYTTFKSRKGIHARAYMAECQALHGNVQQSGTVISLLELPRHLGRALWL